MKNLIKNILKFLKNLILVVLTLVISLVIASYIRFYVGGVFSVEMNSMQTTLKPQDKVIAINEKTFNLPIRRFDVVIVDTKVLEKFYEDVSNPDSVMKSSGLIKRVIALPGERVQIRMGKIYINGNPLDEPYLNPIFKNPYEDMPEIQLGNDEYFVLGDNRISSLDSRVFGPVKYSDIKYVVIYKVDSLTNLKPLNNMHTNDDKQSIKVK